MRKRAATTPAPPAPTTSTDATTGNGTAYRIKLFRSSTPLSFDATMLLGIVALLVVIGLVMVLSSSAVEEFAAGNFVSEKFIKQLLFTAIGVPFMLLVSRLPLSVLTGPLTWVVLGGTVILQLLVFTPLGLEINGNRSWLDFGVTTVQPAEFAKLALILWLAFMVRRKGALIDDWRHLVLPIGLPVAVVIGLALAGQDLGTVMVLGVMVLGALWFGGVRKRFLFSAAGLAGLGVLAMTIISPNRMARISEFLSGECDYENLCWQTAHGYYALARGGVFGVGLGNSTAKWSWLPEADNDFIFAVLGEELGLFGGLAVIGLFVALAIVLLRIWRATDDPAGRVVVGGVFSWLLFQGLVNIAVVLGLLPVLGVPLPFLSSGGSALVTTLAGIGAVLAVTRANTAADPTSGARSTAPAPARRTAPASRPTSSASSRPAPARKARPS